MDAKETVVGIVSERTIFRAIFGTVALALSATWYNPSKMTEIFGFCLAICVYLFKMIQDGRVAATQAAKVEEVRLATKLSSELVARKVEEVRVENKIGSELTAKKVEEVSNSLVDSTSAMQIQLNSIEKVGLASHTLVNSAMGAELKAKAILARRIAESEGATHVDLLAAEMAESIYKDHVSKQEAVDVKAAAALVVEEKAAAAAAAK